LAGETLAPPLAGETLPPPLAGETLARLWRVKGENFKI